VGTGDGKEGVDGSSPSEGVSFLPALVVVFVFRADSGGRPRRPRSVHQRPPRVERVEELDRVLAAVAGEVTVVAVDHRQAGTHVAGEIKGRDAGAKSESRERMPEIVNAPHVRLDLTGADEFLVLCQSPPRTDP
jgi:hypothetical protein